LSNYNSC